MHAEPPCFLCVAVAAGRREGESKNEFLLSPFPFPASLSCMGWGERNAARCGHGSFWYGAGPLFSCCTILIPGPAHTVCVHLSAGFCCPSTVPVCVSLLPPNPESNPSENKILFLWASCHLTPSSSIQCAGTTQRVACRRKRKVSRPKAHSGTPECKRGLEYPNKHSLHRHHYPSESTFYPADVRNLLSLQCWIPVVQILHCRRDVPPWNSCPYLMWDLTAWDTWMPCMGHTLQHPALCLLDGVVWERQDTPTTLTKTSHSHCVHLYYCWSSFGCPASSCNLPWRLTHRSCLLASHTPVRSAAAPSWRTVPEKRLKLIFRVLGCTV